MGKLPEMQRLKRFLYILAYGFLLGTFLSILCWALVMSVLWSRAAFMSNLPHLDASALVRIVFFVVYGGFVGLLIGAQLSVWTGTIIGLTAAAMTASFAFPHKTPILYTRLMQIICMGFTMVCTFLVGRGQFSDAVYPIMMILIAAFVALLVSRRLASWAISRSLAIQ
jgi:hypothetical protein